MNETVEAQLTDPNTPHPIYLIEVKRAFSKPIFVCEIQLQTWPDNWPYKMIGEVSTEKLKCLLKLDPTHTLVVCNDCFISSRYIPTWYKDKDEFDKCREAASQD